MIFQTRYPTPKIDFGFNRQSIEVQPDDVVIVFQDNIYDNDLYTIELLSPDAQIVSVLKDSLNEIRFKVTDVGIYDVIVTITRGNVVLTSNTIQLKISITTDTTLVTSDTTLITADYE